MKDMIKWIMTISLLVLFITTGCSFFAAKGTLVLQLTDAPIMLENKTVTEVNVTITKAMVSRGVAGEDTEIAEGYTGEEVNPQDGEGDAEWITLFQEPRPYNLLNLQNDVTALLGSVELEAGRYNQIRLVVDTNNTIKFEGDETLYDLKIPSGTQSGVKITGGFTIEEDKAVEIVLDFDAAQSVHPRDGGSDYILRPVIKVKKVTK